VSRYTIIAAAALAAGIFLLIQFFPSSSSTSAPTVTLPSKLNLGDPTVGVPDQALADANAALAAGANLPSAVRNVRVVLTR
jgi:hypothetical protein